MPFAVDDIIIGTVVSSLFSFMFSKIIGGGDHYAARDRSQENLKQYLDKLSNEFGTKVRSEIRAAFIEHSYEDIITNTEAAARLLKAYTDTIVIADESTLDDDSDVDDAVEPLAADLASLGHAHENLAQAYSRLSTHIRRILNDTSPSNLTIFVKEIEMVLSLLQAVAVMDALIARERYEAYPGAIVTLMDNIDQNLLVAQQLMDLYLSLLPKRLAQGELANSPMQGLRMRVYRLDGSQIIKCQAIKFSRFLSNQMNVVYGISDKAEECTEIMLGTNLAQDETARIQEAVLGLLNRITRKTLVEPTESAMTTWREVKKSSAFNYLLRVTNDRSVVCRRNIMNNYLLLLDTTQKNQLLLAAVKNNRARLVKLYLQAGADARQSDHLTRETLSQIAVRLQNTAIAKLLNQSLMNRVTLSPNATCSDINLDYVNLNEVESTTRNTILHKIVINNAARVLRAILFNHTDNIDLFALNAQQQTALQIARASGFIECVNLLENIDINKQLLSAARNGNTDALQRYCAHGANINYRLPYSNHTALFEALFNRDDDSALATVQFLLNAGINLYLRNDGRTPRDWAQLWGRTQIVEAIDTFIANNPLAVQRYQAELPSLYCQYCNRRGLVAQATSFENQDTVLHLAVRAQNQNDVQHYLEYHDIDIEAVNADGLTALQLARQLNFPALAIMIASKQLALAAQLGQYQLVQQCLADNANLEYHNHIYGARLVNVWDYAVSSTANNRVAIIALLLEHNEPAHAYKEFSRARKIAACNGDYELVALFDEHCALTRPESNFLLAAARADVQAIQAYLNQGGNIRYCDPDSGHNALYAAVSADSFETVKLLIDNGIFLPRKKYHTGWQDTAFALLDNNQALRLQIQQYLGKLLYEAITDGNFEKVTTLLAAGAAIDYRDARSGETPLHVAVRKFSIRYSFITGFDLSHNIYYCHDSHHVIPLLLDHDANLFTEDSNGISAYQLAQQLSKNLIISYFDLVNNQRMITAVRYKNLTKLRECLAHGAQINFQFQNGRTALHEAVAYDSGPRILQELLDAQIDVTVKDQYGKTALEMANDNHRGQANNPEYVRIINAYMQQQPPPSFCKSISSFLKRHSHAVMATAVVGGGYAIKTLIQSTPAAEAVQQSWFRPGG